MEKQTAKSIGAIIFAIIMIGAYSIDPHYCTVITAVGVVLAVILFIYKNIKGFQDGYKNKD
jgi:hypothetical protein